MNNSFKLGLGLDADGRIADNLGELIGNTPMMNLHGYQKKYGLAGSLAAKLEYFNPLGSVKDRAAKAMLDAAEKSGELLPGGKVAEATSGNMGIALAFLCTLKGYDLVIAMPESMSRERVRLLSALGASVMLTPADQGMKGAIEAVERLKTEDPSVFVPSQFDNPANAAAHAATTGAELLRDTYGKINYLIAGIGTGGTVTGIGRTLKAYRKDIKIIGVEPAASAVLSGGQAGSHGIMGIGAGFEPKVLDRGVIDEIVPVTDEEAFEAARTVAKTDALLVGISSGAALAAARKIAERVQDRHARFVVILPDGGERYLSTSLYETETDQTDP